MQFTAKNTIRLSATDRGIRAGAALLRQGGLVAFPTETVYGLGADACQEAACQAIYTAKGRPNFNPLIVHVSDLKTAEKYAIFSDKARDIAQEIWPGALTWVLPRRAESGLCEAVFAGMPSIAIRVPSHPQARALLEAAKTPIAAPSANRSGCVSPTTADHVMEDLEQRIDAILEGGSCPIGLESTILSLNTQGQILILREGGISRETLTEIIGETPEYLPIAQSTEAPDSDGTEPTENSDRPQSPGRLLKHYAPAASLRLNAQAPLPNEAWLGFGKDPENVQAGWHLPYANLSISEDTYEAAATLYAALRELDSQLESTATIAVASIPNHELGITINERLFRASQGR